MIIPRSEPASRSTSHLLWRAATGIVKHGPFFALEVALFFAILVAFEVAADGYLSPKRVLLLGFLLCAVSLAAGEVRYKLYRRVWAVAGLQDAVAAGAAAGQASLLVAAANALIPAAQRPFHIVLPLLAIPAVAGGVASIRLLPRLRSSAPKADNRLLVVAADASGFSTVKALAQQPNALWSPVAILTTSALDVNKTVMGIPVVGHAQDLEHWAQVTRADGVAFVLDGKQSNDLQPLFALCLTLELPIFIVPGAEDWLYRGPERLRQLSADDLVGRRQHMIDIELADDRIRNRTVAITGAAGSIGSELCRLVARLQPRRMVLIDNNESGLFDIASELQATSDTDVREALVSITEFDALLGVFSEERPDVVFHAAAYKHVPMLEAHPDQAVRVNVLGTYNTLRCAEAVGTQEFVLISTDKAVARHSVMGCTKRVCELMVLTHQGRVRCWAVRFGNVVGSRGSVIPIFERQIQQGGPVTITHPDMTRYMMTIREAVSLVLTTLKVARPGHVYMLDMGEPIKILSLAQALIRARGLRPGADIEIVFTGLRAGERMTEDLLGQDEGVRPTEHESILEVVSPVSIRAEDMAWTVERLVQLAREHRVDELVRTLKQTVIVDARVPGSDEEPAVVKVNSALESPS